MDRFQAIEQHLDFLELMKYTPSIRGRGWLIFMIVFSVLFIVVCFFMLFAVVASGAPPEMALMIIVVVALMGYLFFRWRRAKAAPLQRIPAMVFRQANEGK